MYKSFNITNFKCFRKISLDYLRRVNLIAGMNNVGKTALLEALFLHCGAYKPELILTVNAFRGIEKIQVELSMMSQMLLKKPEQTHHLFWYLLVLQKMLFLKHLIQA